MTSAIVWLQVALVFFAMGIASFIAESAIFPYEDAPDTSRWIRAVMFCVVILSLAAAVFFWLENFKEM